MSYGSWETDEHGDWHDEQHMMGILDGIEEMKRDQNLDLDGVSIGFFWDTKHDYSTFYRSGKEAPHLIVDYKVRDLEPFRRSGWPNGPDRVFERSRQIGVPIMIGFEAQHAWECSRNPDFAVCSIDQVRARGPSGRRPTGLCRGSRIYGDSIKKSMVGYYLGFSGNRGFVALNNGSPRPSEAFLELDAECSFEDSGRWKVRRHWPRDNEGTYRDLVGDDLRLTLEPWEITLLEVVRN